MIEVFVFLNNLPLCTYVQYVVLVALLIVIPKLLHGITAIDHTPTIMGGVAYNYGWSCLQLWAELLTIMGGAAYNYGRSCLQLWAEL